LVLAIGVCYHAKLQERREEYRTVVARSFKTPNLLPGGQRQILREISRFANLLLLLIIFFLLKSKILNTKELPEIVRALTVRFLLSVYFFFCLLSVILGASQENATYDGNFCLI